MLNAHDAARILAEAGALHRDHTSTRPITTLDVCRLSSYPAQSAEIVAALAEHLRPFASDGSTVVSPNTDSMPMATLVATALGLPLAYLRPRPKGHGKQRQVEGVLPEGGNALLLFDAIDGAAAVREAVEIVERHGARATVAAAVLVRDRAGLTAAVAPLGLTLLALTDDTQAEAAVDDGGAARVAVAAGAVATSAPVPAPAPQDSADARQQLKERVARALLSIGAVTINAAQPYRYTSGILSPIYTDNRLLISHPAAWNDIIDGFSSAVATIAQTHGLDGLAGAATAGVPHAARIAQRLAMPMLFVDLNQQERDDEAGGSLPPGKLFGRLEPGDRLVIIEDLVTTGKSVLEFAEALTARQAVVSWCVAIFTYDTAGAEATFAARGLTFESLCDIDTLLGVAVADGNISGEDRAAVHAWLSDRKGWSDRAEARLAAARPA